MQQHYNLLPDQYQNLMKQGVTVSDLLQFAPIFSPVGKTTKSLVDLDLAPITKVSVLYYVDNFGDFTEFEKKPKNHQLIANAIFKSLDANEQIEVLGYISFIVYGEEHDAD